MSRLCAKVAHLTLLHALILLGAVQALSAWSQGRAFNLFSWRSFVSPITPEVAGELAVFSSAGGFWLLGGAGVFYFVRVCALWLRASA
jgi:cytochrome b561